MWSVFCLAIVLAGSFSFLAPPAKASGNVYNFSDIKLTETVEVASDPNGPWTNSNFIRVGKDADFYAKVTISVASLVNKDGQVVQSFDTNNDAIYNPGITTTNFAIKGIGSSFVAKVTQQQAQDITNKLQTGADPTTVGGIPCYSQTFTSGGSAVVNGVIIVGVATAAVLTGGAAVGGAALAVGGTTVGTAIGADSAAIVISYAAGSTAGSAVAGAAGAGLAAKFTPIGPSDYIKCDGPVRPPLQSKGVVKVGDVLYQDIVKVPFTAYKNLGMDPSQVADPTKDASTQPVNEFYVVPDVYFSSWLGLRGDFMSSVGAGKSIYVQLYNSQTDAVAHAKDNVPGSVPNNGSNTGSGQNVGSGPSALLGLISSIINFILGIFQELIYTLFFYVVAPIIQAMLSIHTYTDAFAAVIYPGWVIIRNICNIFFIVALIIIAMATLFRVESYQARHLLVQLIIAALLINFSLVICQAILGLADTVQAQFLPANVTVIRSLAGNLMVGWRGAVMNNSTIFNGTFAGIIQPLFWLALSVGSFCVFCAIAAFLVIRIVALWVLMMISPVAWAVGALPSTSHYRGEWWQLFLKYAFFTPIMAFFLNLTALITVQFQQTKILQQIGSPDLTTSLGGSDLAGFVFTLASNILLLVFLIAGLMVADKFGIMGAKGITDWAKKGVFLPFALAGKGVKAAANFGAEKVLEKKNIELRPQKWIEGFKESRETNRMAREEAGLARAAGRSVLANPTSFFQRYWGVKGIKKAVTGQNREGQKMLDDAAKMEQRANELMQEAKIASDPYRDKAKKLKAEYERKKALGITDNYTLSQAEAAEQQALDAEKPFIKQARDLRKEAEEKSLHAKHLVHEPDYFTQRKSREAENHELSKVIGETWQELFDLAEGSVEEKHIARFKAMMRKLADTYNENELITHWRYTRDMNANETGAWKDVRSRQLLIDRAVRTKKDVRGNAITEEQARSGNFVMQEKGNWFHEDKNGIENFRKLILEEKLGMSEAESMRHLADIGDIAVKRGHAGIWRLYNTKNGRWQMNPYDDWDNEMRVEKGKMSESEHSTTNRLQGADEYTGSNGARIAITQKNELSTAMGFIDNINFRLGRGTYDLNKARSLAFAPNIARLRAMAMEFDNDANIDPVAIGNRPMVDDTEYAGADGSTPLVFKKGQKWTKRDQALYTLSELEKMGKRQFAAGEEKEWNDALGELLGKNQIEERSREDIRQSGLTKVKYTTENGSTEEAEV